MVYDGRRALHLGQVNDAEVLIIVASGYYLDLSLQSWGPNVRAIVKPFEAADIDALIAELRAGGDQRGSTAQVE